jgi:hypothetical protein
VAAQTHTEGFTMLFVEGRTLGVIAALGVVLSMVAAFDRLSDVADSTEPHSPAAVTPASAAPMQALRHVDESALSNPSVAPTRRREMVALREKLNSRPLNHPRN